MFRLDEDSLAHSEAKRKLRDAMEERMAAHMSSTAEGKLLAAELQSVQLEYNSTFDVSPTSHPIRSPPQRPATT